MIFNYNNNMYKKIIQKTIKIILICIALLIIIYGLLRLNLIIGYGDTWKYRVHSNNIEEAKNRNVFVKSLHYRIDSFQLKLDSIDPYIEMGFKFCRHTMDETNIIVGSKYPYQLSFNTKPKTWINIISIRRNELKKFDSSDGFCCWGYLKEPHLKDTITLDIYSDSLKINGIVKVWE